MVAHNKVGSLHIRVTDDQRAKAVKAAAIVSRLRKATVKPSTLVRELAWPELDRIIAENGRREDAA